MPQCIYHHTAFFLLYSSVETALWLQLHRYTVAVSGQLMLADWCWEEKNNLRRNQSAPRARHCVTDRPAASPDPRWKAILASHAIRSHRICPRPPPLLQQPAMAECTPRVVGALSIVSLVLPGSRWALPSVVEERKTGKGIDSRQAPYGCGGVSLSLSAPAPAYSGCRGRGPT